MLRPTIATVILALAAAGFAQAAPPADSLSPEQQMFKLLNLERRNAGLPLLEWNAQLAEAARAHSRKLAGHGELSHKFPGEPLLTERISATGARFNAVAENVALATDPGEAHLALMNSPGHRANILNPQYNAVGVAIVRVKDDIYVTENFARVVPDYSTEQFRAALVAAFNRSRKNHRFAPVDSRFNLQLDRAACWGQPDPKSVLSQLPGASQATVFTASEPSDLPATVQQAAEDSDITQMIIGVCFRADPKDNVSKFWVITAFYSQSPRLPGH